MLTCAHVVHPECAQEMKQNENVCQRCKVSQAELHERKRDGRNERRKYLCLRWCLC